MKQSSSFNGTFSKEVANGTLNKQFVHHDFFFRGMSSMSSKEVVTCLLKTIWRVKKRTSEVRNSHLPKRAKQSIRKYCEEHSIRFILNELS